MTPGLVISGAAVQLVGLLLIFVELAAIRSHEWGIVPPWTRLVRWLRGRWYALRRQLRWWPPSQAHIHPYSGRATLTFGGSLRAKKRPSAVGAEATEAERIAWLERYVAEQDEDVDRLCEHIAGERDEAIAKAKESDEQIRQEIEAREQERKVQLRWSVRRQAVGASCIVVGLVLSTVGGLVN